MTFGDEVGMGITEGGAQKVYETYREAGGNFIDTSEFIHRRARARKCWASHSGDIARVVLATKYSNAAPAVIPMVGNHRKSMIQALEASLKRLQTDYIDLYWVHIWDGITPVEEVMRGLDDIVRAESPLCWHLGRPAWWLAQANTLAGSFPRLDASSRRLQIEYNLIERTVRAETCSLAKALNLASQCTGAIYPIHIHGDGQKAAAAAMTT